MNLHLLVPTLFWPDASLPEIYHDLPLPALENFLAKCSRTDDEPERLEPWLCRVFGVAKQLDWPVAPITLLGEGNANINPADDYWIRADPVHLHVERDRIVLADSRVFPISREVQRRKGHLTEASDEAVVGIEMVQAFGREDDVRDRFHGRAEAVRCCTTVVLVAR